MLRDVYVHAYMTDILTTPHMCIFLAHAHMQKFKASTHGDAPAGLGAHRAHYPAAARALHRQRALNAPDHCCAEGTSPALLDGSTT